MQFFRAHLSSCIGSPVGILEWRSGLCAISGSAWPAPPGRDVPFNRGVAFKGLECCFTDEELMINRRSFCSLTAGALFGSGWRAEQAGSVEAASRLRFTQERTGAGPYSASPNGRPPHILFISADMVGPDLYHPARPFSQHVGVNFNCGVQHVAADGHRYLYAYHCTSQGDELYDLDSEDAANLIGRPERAATRAELIHRLGAALSAPGFNLNCCVSNGQGTICLSM